jgi:hypothetical protein
MDGLTAIKSERAKAFEAHKAERAKATKEKLDKMPVSYFAADYLAQYGQHTVTVRVLDGTLAKFNKKVTKRILAYCQYLSDSIFEDGLAPLIDRIKALEKELAEVKAAPPPTLADSYRGIWQPGTYERGATVTNRGSLWLCVRATTGKPGAGGSDESGWQMIVKAGKDGRDADTRALESA